MFPPPNTPIPEAAPTDQPLAARDPALADEWDDLRQKIASLNGLWSVEATETERRRQLRMLKVNVKERQEKGEIGKDETYIPVRVAQDNISKESPQFVSYLTSSRNVVVFKPKRQVVNPQTGAELPTEKLEQGFTKTARYPGWEIPHFRVVDGSQAHGWDAVEVVFDENKPGNYALEHIQHDRLWFPEDTENLQDAPLLVRVYHLSKKKMMEMFPSAESKEQIKQIFYDRDTKTEVNKSLGCIYKCYYRRDDGIVYTCWLNPERCDWFIREPMPLFRGRRKVIIDSFSGITIGSPPIFETRYPIHLLPYMITEDGRIIRTKGRVFLDEYTQEAVSSLISSIVNGFHRATQPYASPEDNNINGGKVEQLDIKLQAGGIYSRKLNFWGLPYPDPAGLQMVNALITQNKQEAGQTSYATLNRDQPGDRKTAREINAAMSQAALLGTVQVTLYSVFLKDVYTDAWSITSSRLEQGLLDIDIDPAYLQTEYDLYAAGDTEVIQRDETIQRLMMMWPIMSQTPAAMKLLVDLLTLVFPSKAQSYVEALAAGDPKAVIIEGLQQVIKGIATAHPEVIPPESYEQLGTLMQQAEQAKNNISGPVSQEQPAQEPVAG